VRPLLFFVPALSFGLVALVFSALAFKGDQMRDPEEVIVRNRHATQVAVVAVVLCALSLLFGAGLLVLQAFPLGD
jgi:uncharacterized protein YqhQ